MSTGVLVGDSFLVAAAVVVAMRTRRWARMTSEQEQVTDFSKTIAAPLDDDMDDDYLFNGTQIQVQDASDQSHINEQPNKVDSVESGGQEGAPQKGDNQQQEHNYVLNLQEAEPTLTLLGNEQQLDMSCEEGHNEAEALDLEEVEDTRPNLSQGNEQRLDISCEERKVDDTSQLSGCQSSSEETMVSQETILFASRTEEETLSSDDDELTPATQKELQSVVKLFQKILRLDQNPSKLNIYFSNKDDQDKQTKVIVEKLSYAIGLIKTPGCRNYKSELDDLFDVIHKVMVMKLPKPWKSAIKKLMCTVVSELVVKSLVRTDIDRLPDEQVYLSAFQVLLTGKDVDTCLGISNFGIKIISVMVTEIIPDLDLKNILANDSGHDDSILLRIENSEKIINVLEKVMKNWLARLTSNQEQPFKMEKYIKLLEKLKSVMTAIDDTTIAVYELFPLYNRALVSLMRDMRILVFVSLQIRTLLNFID